MAKTWPSRSDQNEGREGVEKINIGHEAKERNEIGDRRASSSG